MFKHANEVKIFKALADDNRLEILELLMDGEKCGCKLLEELKVGQSTLSHHMKVLCDAGIVDSYKDGKWMHYSICNDGFEHIQKLINLCTHSPDKTNDYTKCTYNKCNK